MKQFITALLLLVGISTQAQHYWYTSSVDSVKESGYYNILLDKRIVAVSGSSSLFDIRINDNVGNEVPYFVRNVSPVRQINNYQSYQIESNTTKDSINTLIIRNENKETLDRFYIVVQKADVSKYLRLRGSKNKRQWYIVKKEENVSYPSFEMENKEVLVIDFPPSNYEYYEISLRNPQNSPLEVFDVVKFYNSNVYTQQSKIDLGAFIKEDRKNKKTYITFPELKYNYRLDKLTFSVNSKAEFYREAQLIDKEGYDKARFDLSSKHQNAIRLNQISLGASDTIVIDNKANPALQIDSIQGFALNRYLCAYLEKGQQYTLVIGNKDIAPSGDYDIERFRADIPNDLQIVSTQNFKAIEKAEEKEEIRDEIWIERPIFLWGIIILVGILLTVLCYKMIVEMKKKEQKK